MRRLEYIFHNFQVYFWDNPEGIRTNVQMDKCLSGDNLSPAKLELGLSLAKVERRKTRTFQQILVKTEMCPLSPAC